MSGSLCPLPRDDTLNTSFAEYLAFSLIFLFLQVPHKFGCATRAPAIRFFFLGGGAPALQLYGAGAYVTKWSVYPRRAAVYYVVGADK